MEFDALMFYCQSFMMLLGALGVVFSRNSVRAVLFLVLTFVMAAFNWMLIEAEFLSIILVLVYVGAVMVLFLFVVMMLDVDVAALKQSFVKQLPLALLVAGSFVGSLLLMLHKSIYLQDRTLTRTSGVISNTEQLGQALYTDYLYQFEIAGVLLLTAIIAAIALTFRGRQESKKQVVSKQVQISKSDRLQLLKMPAVKGEDE